MQGKKRLIAALSGFAALAISAPALAGVMSIPYGWYLEANFGSTHLSDKSYGGGSSNVSGIGGNVNLGYKFMPYVATEIGYTRYANVTIKDPTTGNKAGNDKFYSYDLALRGILPIIDSGFELFAKLGVQRLNSHININNVTAANNINLQSGQHSVTGLYYGVGAQYYFMPELAINVQWQRAQGNSTTGNLDLFSVGISFILN